MTITLYRRHEDGSAHYVTITDRQGNLFGYPTLSVIAGGDFFVTSERHITYENEVELQRSLRRMLDRRKRAGYAVLYSYFRAQQAPLSAVLDSSARRS